MKAILEYDYPNGYDYEKDAEMVGLKYSGCFETYLNGISSYGMVIWSRTPHSATLNFQRWLIEITKVKEKHYIREQREIKIDSIL